MNIIQGTPDQFSRASITSAKIALLAEVGLIFAPLLFVFVAPIFAEVLNAVGFTVNAAREVPLVSRQWSFFEVRGLVGILGVHLQSWAFLLWLLSLTAVLRLITAPVTIALLNYRAAFKNLKTTPIGFFIGSILIGPGGMWAAAIEYPKSNAAAFLVLLDHVPVLYFWLGAFVFDASVVVTIESVIALVALISQNRKARGAD